MNLVLGGGVALGAYHAGAYAALHEVPELHPTRMAGSSVGAVIGALILGNAPQERMARLRLLGRCGARHALVGRRYVRRRMAACVEPARHPAGAGARPREAVEFNTRRATPKAITLAYRAPSYEGGVEKPFNFSRSRSAGPPGSAT